MKKVLSAIALLLLIAISLTSCSLLEPQPKIKQGEFKFSVTYEYQGEVNTVSGVYVCEYAGLEFALDGGFYREWTGYVKDDAVPEHILLKSGSEDGIEVILSLGINPDHLMGETIYFESHLSVPTLMVIINNEEGMSVLHDVDEIKTEYGARIISYEYDEPIKNTFK